MQISHHDWSFTNIIGFVISYYVSGGAKRKAHDRSIYNGLIERQILLVPNSVQIPSVIHKPGVQKMLAIISIVWLGTVQKESNHLQSCAQIVDQKPEPRQTLL